MIDGVLDRLLANDPTSWAQGLSAPMARRCLQIACEEVRKGFPEALDGWEKPPATTALVAAHGVFTSPLEWVLLYAARGVSVHLKAPSRDPRFCEALGAACRAEGLAVAVSTDRALPEVDAVLAFGSDDTMVQLEQSLSRGQVLRRYGHRFSVVVLQNPSDADLAGAALDVALYDSRGCFAPAAVVLLDAPEEAVDQLAEHMARLAIELPRGAVDPSLGVEWRRRVGLARITHQVREGEGWSIAVLGPEHFVPVALPRLATVIQASRLDFLKPYVRFFSSCATNVPKESLPDGFHRVVAPGMLQQPRFPRSHDGLPMTLQVERLAKAQV